MDLAFTQARSEVNLIAWSPVAACRWFQYQLRDRNRSWEWPLFRSAHGTVNTIWNSGPHHACHHQRHAIQFEDSGLRSHRRTIHDFSWRNAADRSLPRQLQNRGSCFGIERLAVLRDGDVCWRVAVQLSLLREVTIPVGGFLKSESEIVPY